MLSLGSALIIVPLVPRFLLCLVRFEVDYAWAKSVDLGSLLAREYHAVCAFSNETLDLDGVLERKLKSSRQTLSNLGKKEMLW